MTVYVSAGQGSAQVAATAQQLLEHSLLTELQGVVARTLQGVDMFTQPHLADILGHAQRSQHGQTTSQADNQSAPQVCPLCKSHACRSKIVWALTRG